MGAALITRIRAHAVAQCAALLAVAIGATAAAQAAQTRGPITGKLSQPGFDVIALEADGPAKVVRTKRGKFRIRHPDEAVTLHLRNRDGVYGGPIVADRERHGKRAILGVEPGTRLGDVKVKRDKDYARVEDAPPDRRLDETLLARAKHGVPVGAGRVGRVRSKHGGAPGDNDFDGIPDPLDVDDDGDLVLDNLDVEPAPRLARATAPRLARGMVTEIFDVHTGMNAPLESTANANAPGVTDAQIESALPTFGAVLMEIIPGDSAELDCGGTPNPAPPPPLLGGLSYCSTGGTGRVFQPGVSPEDWEHFPDCCDADGDGYGSLVPVAGGPAPAMFLNHGATTAQIGTGDVLVQRVTTNDQESQLPAALQFVFATVPALVSYGDTAGNSTTVSYPVAPPMPGPGGPGTLGNEFPIAAGPDGDVVLTLTFWRPQRRPIPPEGGDWIDIGGLTYSTVVSHLGVPPGGTAVQQWCPQSSYSTTDPDLTLPPAEVPDPGFMDLAPDRPTDALNTLTYTVNLTDCLAALGFTWGPGQEASIHFPARMSRADAPDAASQSVWFKQVP